MPLDLAWAPVPCPPDCKKCMSEVFDTSTCPTCKAHLSHGSRICLSGCHLSKETMAKFSRLMGEVVRSKPGPKPTSPSERFWSKVSKTTAPGDECWLWLGGMTNGGYGIFFLNRDGDKKNFILAHKWAWEQEHGPVPEGKELDHSCDTPSCVRPSHVRPMTHLENVRRGAKAKQTHCKHGHEFTEKNIYRHKNGTRDCRQCRIQRNKNYVAAKGVK